MQEIASEEGATMSESHNGRTPIDLGLYSMNWLRFPPDELGKYKGEHVAVSPDGTRIVAHGLDLDSVIEELQQRGIHFSEVGWSFVPDVDSLL
jgi:Family of unknown function (DUF5678)